MKKKDFKNIDNEYKFKIINFYENHSGNQTLKKYKLTLNQLHLILNEFNIKIHSNIEGQTLFCKDVYGVSHISQTEQSRQKLSKTWKNKSDSEKLEIKSKKINTNLQKYGCEYASQNNEIKEKIFNTNLQKYGCKYVPQVEEIKDKMKSTLYKNYGVTSPLRNEELKIKRINTLRLNENFGKSFVEDLLYDYLVLKYGEKDVTRQYSEERYPFACDFYIHSKDLFIELNAFPTHYKEPFDNNNLEHIKLLEHCKNNPQNWIEKEMVNIWAGTDVIKKKYSKEK